MRNTTMHSYRSTVVTFINVIMIVFIICVASAEITQIVSISSDGRISSGETGGASRGFVLGPSISMSADGRYIAFASSADDLVPNDTNADFDVFVHDRQTGQTHQVSIATDGTQGNDMSGSCVISSNGRFVAFASYASNLVPDDTNSEPDVFVHDCQTGTTKRVSVASDGTQGLRHGGSYCPSLSADGRLVAFVSWSNLAPGVSGQQGDIFIHDSQTGDTSRVSSGVGYIFALWPFISADGRYVAYYGGAGTSGNIYRFDSVTQQTITVSIATDGSSLSTSTAPVAISPDGRLVYFNCDSSNYLGGPNRWFGLYVHDCNTGESMMVSQQKCKAVSSDGRFVAYPENGHALLLDRLTGNADIVAVASDGTLENGYSGNWMSISADGRFVAFDSSATNFMPGIPDDQHMRFYVRDRGSNGWIFPEGTIIRASNPYDSPAPDSGKTRHRLKGALHVHWYDDNNITKPGDAFTRSPVTMEKTYKDLGYNFIALTEHNHMTPEMTTSSIQDKSFVHVEDSEEVTSSSHHILAVGADGKRNIGEDLTGTSWKTSLASGLFNDPVLNEVNPTSNMQGMIDDITSGMGGLAFIPHPKHVSLVNLSRNASLSDLKRLKGFAALSIRTAASLAESTADWDEALASSRGSGLLIDGKWRYSPVLGYTEGDYTPPGFYPIGSIFVPAVQAGSTWILLDAYYDDTDWDVTNGGNTIRSLLVMDAIRTGRWWSYWTKCAVPWKVSWVYPKLDLQTETYTNIDGQIKTKVTVTSDLPLDTIRFIGMRPDCRKSGDLCEPIHHKNSAYYICNGGETYVRIEAEYNPSIMKPNLYIASQPIWVYPEGRVVGPYGDSNSAPARASIQSGIGLQTTSPALQVEYVIPDNYPVSAPPLGYIRHVYNVMTESGACPADATLTLQYLGEDITAVGESNLRIFHWDTVSSTWIPLESTADMDNKELTANITELGIYTISAVPQEDVTVPAISIVRPSANEVITDLAPVLASASDNLGVAQVTFYLNGRQIADDSVGIDGWGEEIDFSHYVSGNYTLTADAVDLQGNKTTATRQIVLQSNATAPVVTLTTPVPSIKPTTSTFTLSGKVTDADGFVAGVNIEVNGNLAGIADIQGDQWTCTIPTSSLGDSSYTVKITAMDDYGNTSVANYQPDLLIKSGTESSYSGTDLYSIDGSNQVKSQSAAPGQKVTYAFRVKNAGIQNDSFKITGPGSVAGWNIRYYESNTGIEVTSQVTGGGWSSGTLAPGGTKGISVSVKPDATLSLGSVNTLLITAASDSDNTKIDVVKAVTGFTGTYKTDMLIKSGPDTSYSGTNIYNTDGTNQTKLQNVCAGQKVTYGFRARNGGNASDSFRITGPAGGIGWSVKYYDFTTNADVTSQVTGAGWISRILAPGTIGGVFVNIKPDSTVPLGSSITLTVTGTSMSDNTKIDVVKAITTCVASYKADLLIKLGTESTYSGLDIINTDGTNQTKTQNAAINQKVTCSFRVKNAGFLSDSFKITGPGGGGGWTVKYIDLASGADVTSQVTGTGWLSGTMAPGTDKGVYAKITPDATLTSGSSKTLTITAASISSPTKIDVVKAITTVP